MVQFAVGQTGCLGSISISQTVVGTKVGWLCLLVCRPFHLVRGVSGLEVRQWPGRAGKPEPPLSMGA